MTILFLYCPHLLFIFFVMSLFFPTLMNFYNKRLHSFMILAPYVDHHHTAKNKLNNTMAVKCHDPNPIICSAVSGSGLTGNAATGGEDGFGKPDNDINAVESATHRISLSLYSPSPLSSFSIAVPNGDLDRNGFFDDIGGSVNGLMSCTECVGFESSDEKRVVVDDEMGDVTISTSSRDDSCQDVYGWRWCRSGSEHRWSKVGRGVKKFPPPLSSLNINGQPRFFLQPERKDGRLQLTEVRVQRMEVLRASRQDGRLRLHLVREEDAIDFLHQHQQVEAEEEEIAHDQQEVEKEEEKKQGQVDEERNEEEEQGQEEKDDGDEEEEEGEVKVDVIEQVERVEEWKFPVSGKGFSRCYELINHHQYYHHNQHQPYEYHMHHHNHFLAWGQHCLTTG